ncbi:MAG: vWA domain-containing protein [Candidatus Sulfotelmatobacter sp.]
MADNFSGAASKNKADGVADAINKLLQNLVIRCAKEEGVRDYFHVGVIGYGATVGPAFSGALAGKELVPISEIANSPARIEERNKKVDDGAGGLVEQKIKFPIWFDPTSNGGTPMCQALSTAKGVLQRWLGQHPNGFPPAVIQITDGESTDGDPAQAMNDLKALSSNDGNILLFNLHISSNPNAQPTAFPDSSASLPDQYSRQLFDGASVLTPLMRSVAGEHGFSPSDGARCFVLNADLVLVIQALDIGTRASNLR